MPGRLSRLIEVTGMRACKPFFALRDEPFTQKHPVSARPLSDQMFDRLLIGVRLPPACIKMSHPEVVPVTVAGGVLTSPFFSDHVTYPTSLDCLWRLSTEDDFYPVVLVEQFDLEPRGGAAANFQCRDAFIVHFPDLGPDRSEYGNFCGSQIPRCFYYAGRHIDIRFFTDGNTQSNTGWRITYNASRTPVCPTEAAPVLVSTIASNTETAANTGVGPTEAPQIPTTPPGLTIIPSERPPLVGAIVGGTLACVAIVTMLLLWCFCCYWRRRKRPPQVAETLANPGARPDIVIFRNGEDRTSLMNPNYGQRAEFTALAAMSSNRGATPDNCYSGGDLKQPLLDGATSPGVESPRHTGPPKFMPPSPPAARHAGPPKFVPPSPPAARHAGPPKFVPPSPPRSPSGKDWSGGPDDVFFEDRSRTYDDPRPKFPAKRTPPYAQVSLLDDTYEKGGNFTFDVAGDALPLAEGYDEPMATASRDSGHGTAGSDADGYEVPIATRAQELEEDADGYAVPMATALPNNQSRLGYDHLHDADNSRKQGIGYDRLHGNKNGYDQLSRESDKPPGPRSSKYSKLDNRAEEEDL
ncbi:lectin serine [Branchiostoma belcheri]|nr:lectin serine [Branchiostoma belcheri]